MKNGAMMAAGLLVACGLCFVAGHYWATQGQDAPAASSAQPDPKGGANGKARSAQPGEASEAVLEEFGNRVWVVPAAFYEDTKEIVILDDEMKPTEITFGYDEELEFMAWESEQAMARAAQGEGSRDTTYLRTLLWVVGDGANSLDTDSGWQLVPVLTDASTPAPARE